MCGTFCGFLPDMTIEEEEHMSSTLFKNIQCRQIIDITVQYHEFIVPTSINLQTTKKHGYCPCIGLKNLRKKLTIFALT